MNINEKIKELGQTIQDFRDSVTLQIQRLSFESEEYEGLKRKFEEVYTPKLTKKIEKVIEVLNSPVAVGLIGRYSHGKTALLNRIFSIPEEYALPEGEGIVTSQITRVDFEEGLSFPKAYVVKRTGEKEEISLKALRESVGPSTSFKADEEDASIVDYYHLELPANKDFGLLFSRDNIAIIDMPGIGGRYFKDTVLTRNTIENTDFILVIIKITEIDKAGRAVEPIIAGIKNIPIIPVFTFFDEAAESVIFSDCKDEEEIMEKAKEMAKEYLPSISKWVSSRSVFVSNKDGTNIPQLRETILNFVEERMSPIPKQKQQKPELFKKKIYEISSNLVDLIKFLNNFVKDIEGEIEKNKPSVGKKPLELDLSQVGKTEMRGIKLRIKDIIRGYRNEIDSKVSSLMLSNNEVQFGQYLSDIDIAIQGLSNKLEAAIQNEFADIKSSIKVQMEKVLDRKINLPPDKKQELLYEILDRIDSYIFTPSFVEDVKEINIMKYRPIISLPKDKIRQIIQSLQNPQILITIVIEIIIIFLGFSLEHVPLIGKAGKILGIIGIIGLIATIFVVLFLTPPSKRFFEREKSEKIRDIRRAVSDLLSSLNDSVVKDLESALDEMKTDVLETISEFTDTAFTDYKRNKDVINDIKRDKEKLQKEIELFSESLGIELIS